MSTVITIKVINVRVLDDEGEDLGPHLMARGFMGSQLFIDGRIRAGHAPSIHREAVAEVEGWLRKNRPDWDIVLPTDETVASPSHGTGGTL